MIRTKGWPSCSIRGNLGKARTGIPQHSIDVVQNRLSYPLTVLGSQQCVGQGWVSANDTGDKLLWRLAIVVFVNLDRLTFFKHKGRIQCDLSVDGKVLGKGYEIKVIGIAQIALLNHAGSKVVDVRLVFRCGWVVHVDLESSVRVSNRNYHGSESKPERASCSWLNSDRLGELTLSYEEEISLELIHGDAIQCIQNVVRRSHEQHGKVSVEFRSQHPWRLDTQKSKRPGSYVVGLPLRHWWGRPCRL